MYDLTYIKNIEMEDLMGRLGFCKERGKYNCPLCGSGTGENRSSAFVVYPDDRGFHCFSCNTGSTPIDFIMQYYNLEFGKAVERIAELYGIAKEENKIEPIMFHVGWKIGVNESGQIDNLRQYKNANHLIATNGNFKEYLDINIETHEIDIFEKKYFQRVYGYFNRRSLADGIWIYGITLTAVFYYRIKKARRLIDSNKKITLDFGSYSWLCMATLICNMDYQLELTKLKQSITALTNKEAL